MTNAVTIAVDELTAISLGETPALPIEMQRLLVYIPKPGDDHGMLEGDATALSAAAAALKILRAAAAT